MAIQSQSMKKKCFILDTSVLLHDENSPFAFKNAIVAIPLLVLEELDTFKTETAEKGRSSRAVIRLLDELRTKGTLNNGGVSLDPKAPGAILKVLPEPATDDLPTLSSNPRDNEIFHSIQQLTTRGFDVVYVTKDINSRVKADALGIKVEDYIKDAIAEEKFYKGWLSVPIPAAILKTISTQKISNFVDTKNLFMNQFVVLESENNPENARIFRFLGGSQFKSVEEPKLKWNMEARNRQQLMALDLLLDDSIKMVSLVGPAGTGKTLLALLAGLQKVASEHQYRRLLAARPIVALGADIGYLPGDIQEKLLHWMKPIYDNLEHIFSETSFNSEHVEEKFGLTTRERRSKRHQAKYQPHLTTAHSIEMLQQRGILSMEAITYMRGRSLPYQYIFIDEVQNMTPHEAKTLVSRVGDGSKIILAGDPYQIDSPYLTFSTNGLTVVSERFKGQRIFGTVYLDISERSMLSKLAAELL